MRRIKVVLCGCLGKMGLEVTKISKYYLDIEIVAGITKGLEQGKKFPIFNNFEDLSVDCDMVLDFSSPSCLDSILKFITERNISAVICTTGYNEFQMVKIEKASEIVPIFLSSNTSRGISVIAKLIPIAKKLLGEGYDVEIIEKHHNKKVDAPSGTAIMLAREVSEENTSYVYDRTNRKCKRDKNEIGIHTVRCGGIKGEHEIIFANEYETLVFKHSAHSRELFAYGALDAVRFMANTPPGMYTMNDLIDNNLTVRRFY